MGENAATARRPKTTARALACASAGLPVRSTLPWHASRTNFAAGDVKTANVGGQWDFGFAKLMGQYNQVEFDSAASATPKARAGWSVA